jgi:hypothetical protein
MPVDVTERINTRRMEVKRQLQKQGFVLPPRPAFDIPKIPLALTDLADDQVIRLYVKLTRYQDHVHGQLVEAEIDEASAENIVEFAKARFLAESWQGTSQDRVAVQKAQALTDNRVKELTENYEKARAKRKLYTVMLDSLARDANVVSREISRRIAMQPGERRADRFSA